MAKKKKLFEDLGLEDGEVGCVLSGELREAPEAALRSFVRRLRVRSSFRSRSRARSTLQLTAAEEELESAKADVAKAKQDIVDITL